MRLTVIGNNGAVPRPGGACSGYLVEDKGTRLLLDCGSGVYGKLQEKINPFTLDAIVISHMHADHFFDLVPFRYALFYALSGRRESPLPLWLPPGGTATLTVLAQSFGSLQNFFAEVFAVREFAATEQMTVGGLNLRFQIMPHFVPSYGVRVEGTGTLVYSGDTAECPEIVALARGAHTLLCEATAQRRTYEQTKAGHVSAAGAGRIASESGVGRLLLTHIWHELDPAVSI
ncbi:MAG: MBL fold metallo-hydrolase, partial [Chloroflexota bacterium]